MAGVCVSLEEAILLSLGSTSCFGAVRQQSPAFISWNAIFEKTFEKLCSSPDVLKTYFLIAGHAGRRVLLDSACLPGAAPSAPPART
jgi:hypothetical protein